jgi:hypothetical protein
MTSDGDLSMNSDVPNANPVKINLKRVGFPGEPYSMVLTNVFKDPDSHLNRFPPSGLPGDYQVIFVLGRPGVRVFPENEIKFAEFMRGDSHLAILPPAFPAPIDAAKIRIEVKVEGESFAFEGLANEEGFLAKLKTHPFHAQNRNDAELRSTRVVQTVLSEYSASLDIPIQVDLIEVTEIATSNKSLTLTALFRTGGSTAPIKAFDPEFANLAALYREALISNTPAYRYLCFYKILEASRKRRELLGRKLKKQYRPVREGEVIPASHAEQISWLKAIFIGPQDWDQLTLNQIFPPEARGKKLTALFDSELRPLRDRIAHGILDSGKYLHVDDLVAIREITKWLPLVRCAARRTLKNDFPEHYLPYLNEDGSITHE